MKSFKIVLTYNTRKSMLVWANSTQEAESIAKGEKNGRITILSEKTGKIKFKRTVERERFGKGARFIHKKQKVYLTRTRTVIESGRRGWIWQFFTEEDSKPVGKKVITRFIVRNFTKKMLKKHFKISLGRIKDEQINTSMPGS